MTASPSSTTAAAPAASNATGNRIVVPNSYKSTRANARAAVAAATATAASAASNATGNRLVVPYPYKPTRANARAAVVAATAAAAFAGADASASTAEDGATDEDDAASDNSDTECYLDFAQPLSDMMVQERYREDVDEMLVRAQAEGASDTYISAMRECIRAVDGVFRSNLAGTTGANVPEMTFELREGAVLPTRMHLRRFSPLQTSFMREHIDALLEAGVVEPSSSAFVSPVLLVRKKDGSWRMCIDLRKLNSMTVPVHWPLPKLDQLFARTQGAKVYATFDLLKGYWQFPIAPHCRPRTSFATPFGTFQFARVVMGARNSASHFQRIMQEVLGELADTICAVYLDDILVYAETEQQLAANATKVLQRLHQ